MKYRNKVLIITEGCIFIVVTAAMFFSIIWIDPVASLPQVFRIILPFLLITYVSIFIVFRILTYYYLLLLHQKQLIEKLNASFVSFGKHVKTDDLLKQGLESLMGFCKCPMGIMLVVDERLKKYASGEVITLNISTFSGGGNAKTDENDRRMITFFPSDIPTDIDKKIRGLLKEYDFEKCRTVVTIPFAAGGKVKTVAVVGVANMSRKEVRKVFDDMKHIIDIFIRKLNIELENSILHEEINRASITDPLTQLYNRRYFNKRAKEEFVKAKRMGFPVSVMISDLDNFKNYVDTYGHPKGDIILMEIASVINKAVRESDMVCRFGGDEFAYLLPFASSVEANALAERIKKTVSQFVFLKDDADIGQSVHITLSMGIASFPEHGENEQDIISKADNALFLSKKNGKNMISVYKDKEG